MRTTSATSGPTGPVRPRANQVTDGVRSVPRIENERADQNDPQIKRPINTRSHVVDDTIPPITMKFATPAAYLPCPPGGTISAKNGYGKRKVLV